MRTAIAAASAVRVSRFFECFIVLLLFRLWMRGASGEQTAVDGDDGASDVFGGRTREKGDRGGDVRRRAEAAERAQAALVVGTLTVRGIHVRVGRPRLHQVRRDVL